MIGEEKNVSKLNTVESSDNTLVESSYRSTSLSSQKDDIEHLIDLIVSDAKEEDGMGMKATELALEASTPQNISLHTEKQDEANNQEEQTSGSSKSTAYNKSEMSVLKYCLQCRNFNELSLRSKMKYYTLFFFFGIFLGAFAVISFFLWVKWGGKLNGEPNLEIIRDLNIMLLFFSMLSFGGSCYIFGTVSYRKFLRENVQMHFIASLAFTDAIFAIKFILSSSLGLAGVNEINDDFIAADIYSDGTFPHGLCILSALVGQFFGLATISWNAVIGFIMWKQVLYPIEFRQSSNSYKKKAHIFVWTLSTITIVIPLIAQAAGSPAIGYTSDGTCWLNQGYVFLFYVPLYLFVIACMYFLISVYRNLKEHSRSFDSRSSNDKFVGTVIYRVTCFTFAFITIWLWGAIIRIWDNIRLAVGLPVLSPFEPGEIEFVFTQAFFLAFGGFLNCIIWVKSIMTIRKNKKKNGTIRMISSKSRTMLLKRRR